MERLYRIDPQRHLRREPTFANETFLISLAAPDHRQQALRHDDRHRDMDGEEDHDCGRGGQMDEPCGVISAEQGGKLAQLYRLPDGYA
jgi:hypothetical protein